MPRVAARFAAPQLAKCGTDARSAFIAFHELFASMGDLSRREQLLSQINRAEIAIASATQLRDEAELKTEDIEEMLSTLREADLTEKKDKN